MILTRSLKFKNLAMKVWGGAPAGGGFPGMRCTLSNANKNASLPYVFMRRFSRYLAGSLPFSLSGSPMKRRLQRHILFSMSFWCEWRCWSYLCISSVVCCMGCRISSAVLSFSLSYSLFSLERSCLRSEISIFTSSILAVSVP